MIKIMNEFKPVEPASRTRNGSSESATERTTPALAGKGYAQQREALAPPAHYAGGRAAQPSNQNKPVQLKEAAGTGSDGGGGSNDDFYERLEEPPPPLHERFVGNGSLERLHTAEGATLAKGDRDAVGRVQQALSDMGFSLPFHGVDKLNGGETEAAVSRFQETAGLEPTGVVDQDTLHELCRRAPAAGKRQDKTVDYGKLLADHKLEITVAFGYDKPNRALAGEGDEFLAWAAQKGFEEKKREGTTIFLHKPHTFMEDVGDVYPLEHDVTVILKVILPGAGAANAYGNALANDEVVVYSGHARGGSGPDFDPSDSGQEHFVMGANTEGHRKGQYKGPNHHAPAGLAGRENRLEKMSKAGDFKSDKYQVWMFNACTSLNYLDEVRGGLVEGKDRKNLDVIGTNAATLTSTYAEVTIDFIEGILNQKGIEESIRKWSEHAQEGIQHFHDGFGDNPDAPQGQ